MLHVSNGKLTDSKYASAVNEAATDVAKRRTSRRSSTRSPAGRLGAEQGRVDRLSVGDDDDRPGSMSVSDAQRIIDAASKPAQAAGIEVADGRPLGQKVSKPSTESSELIGIVAAMFILTFMFGTVVAMLLPIINAIIALSCMLRSSGS